MSISASTVLTQAQSLEKSSVTQHKNGVKTEENDIKKASSIFTAAQKIVESQKEKGSKVSEKYQQKIQNQQDKAKDIADNKLNPTKQLIDEYKSKLEELKQKKETLEKQLTAEQTQLAQSNVKPTKTKTIKKQIEVQKQNNNSKAEGKNNNTGGTQIIEIEQEVVDPSAVQTQSGSSDVYAEYQQVLSDMGGYANLIQETAAKSQEIIQTIVSVGQEIRQLNNEATQELNSVQNAMETQVNSKNQELGPLKVSEQGEAQSNTTVSQQDTTAATAARQTADQLESNDPDKAALEAVADDLDSVSGDLSDLAEINTSDYTTVIPGYSNDISKLIQDAVSNGGFESYNTALHQAYETAMGIVKETTGQDIQADEQKPLESQGSTSVLSDIGSNIDFGGVVQSALNGGSFGDIAMSIFSQVGNQLTNGIFGEVLGVFGGLFG